MKDFKDNLDEENIDKQGTDRFAQGEMSHSFLQRVLKALSRYSLLIVVAVAALAITVLLFQGKQLLQALRGTPLPIFWLEKIIAPKSVPDKTKVYQDALQEEAKQAQRKRTQQKNITRPHWQASYAKDTTRRRTTAVAVRKDTTSSAPPKKQRTVRRKKLVPEEDVVVATDTTSTINFFQAVKATGEPTTGIPNATSSFTACVVHGDQEVGNNQRLTLRLTEVMQLGGKTIPSGTLVYGMVRLSQDRVQVSVSRIGEQVASFQVYDHTYHLGILLDERQNAVEDATKQTAYRQGQRRVREIPIPGDAHQIASELARDLLQRARRKNLPAGRQGRSVFLPDGYPLYLAGR